MITEYLKLKELTPSKVVEYVDKEPIPTFVMVPRVVIYRIQIDMTDPTHPTEYVKLEAYRGQTDQTKAKPDIKCQHESEWKEINRAKFENLNKYNKEITEFIEKYAVETTNTDFVCRICGQILPLKKYVQDGIFDNNTQKFVSSYTPSDTPLEDIKEYQKYKLIIRTLDGLINRLSLITGTNMLVGSNLPVKQKRKALVKNIIDLIVKHNATNMHNRNREERMEIFAKKFNINKDLDGVFFFELEDSILNFTPNSGEVNADLNRLKFNNILLYFLLIFITELNSIQISLMSADKFSNIYVYLKYGPKLFGNLLIKNSINDTDTKPITDYPIFCYLIFILSYFLIKYKLWYYPSTSKRTFDPFVQKIIIHSIVDLFNGIAINAGKMPNDYVYLLVSSKLYAQLNSTFKDAAIIRSLKLRQMKFSDKKTEVEPSVVHTIVQTYSLVNPSKTVSVSYPIPTFKLSDGIQLDKRGELVYRKEPIDDITNCESGDYHRWVAKKGTTDVVCAKCGMLGEQADSKVSRVMAAYYFELNKIAKRKCLDGRIHNFEVKDHKSVCSFCHRTPTDTYTKKELDQLALNLLKIVNTNALDAIDRMEKATVANQQALNRVQTLLDEIINKFQTETNNKPYGQLGLLIDKFIKILEELIGVNTNLELGKYPTYLRDNVYIIDHIFDGALLPEPIILTQHDNKIFFKENHPFFKSDVLYYVDNKRQIDVFYHAVTLKLLGYREKHKEYVLSNKIANNYLRINQSIRNRLVIIGYESLYLDITDTFKRNSSAFPDTNKNYYHILDDLIRDHVFKTKIVIDKFISTIYRIKFYQEIHETVSYLPSSQILNKLVSKYAKLIKNFNIGNDLDKWNDVRDLFMHKKINWAETNVSVKQSVRSMEQLQQTKAAQAAAIREAKAAAIRGAKAAAIRGAKAAAVKETDDRQPNPLTEEAHSTIISEAEGMVVHTDLINYYDVTSTTMIFFLINNLMAIIEGSTERNDKINIAQLYIEIIVYIYNMFNIEHIKNAVEYRRFVYVLNGSNFMVDLLKKGQGLSQSRELEENLNDTTPDLIEITPEEKEEIEELQEEAEALDVESDYFREEDEDIPQSGENED